MEKPKILITNDDGIGSEALLCLYEAVSSFCDVFVVAPAFDQSGSGLSITLRDPLHIEEVPWAGAIQAWKVTGTPADCVKLALGVLVKEKVDLILSGVNRGWNAGRTVLYSGTVGGCIEGVLRGIPALAFSYPEHQSPDYPFIKGIISPLVSYAIQNPLSKGTFLNINFPDPSLPFKGVKLARQGKSYWKDQPESRIHPEGRPYVWLGGKWEDHTELEGSDVHYLREGYVSVAPIHVDELTDHEFLAQNKHPLESLFSGS